VLFRSHGHVIGKLHEHGIRTEKLAEKMGATVERLTIDSIERADRLFQGVREVTIEATPRKEWIGVGDGWHFVTTAQPLGNLIVYLLEPESQDGLATWDLVDPSLDVGDAFPILRVIERSNTGE